MRWAGWDYWIGGSIYLEITNSPPHNAGAFTAHLDVTDDCYGNLLFNGNSYYWVDFNKNVTWSGIDISGVYPSWYKNATPIVGRHYNEEAFRTNITVYDVSIEQTPVLYVDDQGSAITSTGIVEV